MSRPHDCRYRTRVAKHTRPVTGGGSGQPSVLRPRSTSIATRKITRYSSVAFKSTSWELKRQSSEKFLCVAGVGLVKKKREMDKEGIPTPLSDKVGGGKMQTSSPPVITPNRSQSNPDMITLPRPIQSVGMDSHDVSGTSTGQTLPRERRALPGTHFCPTIWWVYPASATIFILHPLLPTFSSTCVRNIKQQLQGSCARVRRI